MRHLGYAHPPCLQFDHSINDLLRVMQGSVFPGGRLARAKQGASLRAPRVIHEFVCVDDCRSLIETVFDV
jgi:hypothetical protein